MGMWGATPFELHMPPVNATTLLLYTPAGNLLSKGSLQKPRQHSTGKDGVFGCVG